MDTSPYPDRSTWEALTTECYDKSAEWMVASKDQETLWQDWLFNLVMEKMPYDPLILDLGCGYGRLEPALFNYGITRIVGVDLSKELLTKAKVRFPMCDFRLGNMLSLSEVVGDTKFDAFFAISSLMHILPEHMPAAARSIRSALKIGAVGHISTPSGNLEELLNHSSKDISAGAIPEGCYLYRFRWPLESLADIFVAAGFKLLKPTHDDGRTNFLTLEAI